MSLAPRLKSRPTPDRIRILVVDDDPAIQRFCRAALGNKLYEVVTVANIAAAMSTLAEEAPDLVLLDLKFPVASGWDLLQVVRENPAYRRMPVVMLTGSEQEQDRDRSLRMGADHHLTKPVTEQRLREVVQKMLATRDDLWWVLSLNSVDSERLRELVYDPGARVQTLAAAVAALRHTVESGRNLNVWWIGLDPLFEVEGEAWKALDELRRRFVRALEIVVAPQLGHDVTVSTAHPGSNDFQCFAGGDESPARTPDIQKRVRKIIDELQHEVGLTRRIEVSVGCARTGNLAIYAPRLLYEAVRSAREHAQRSERRHMRKLQRLVWQAIQDKQIRTFFQPLVNLQSGEMVGMEILSRGPAGTEIEDPTVIFDVARELDMAWDLETLCIENIAGSVGDVCTRGKLFFNLESQFIQQLHYRGLEVLEPLLDRRHDVVIEITERSAIRNFTTFRETLSDLKAMGFLIAIDDCGSGYASLEMVAEMKPDYLKVGHSLLQNIEHDKVRLRLVELVASISRTIQAQPIAEAIENDTQRRICIDLGIDIGQGYHFSRPVPLDDLSSFSKQSRLLP